MEENNQINISLTLYILIIVVSLSLIAGYLIKHLNRREVETEQKSIVNYSDKLDSSPYGKDMLDIDL